MKSGMAFLQSLLRVFLVIATMTVFTKGDGLFFHRHIKPVHYDITLIPCMSKDPLQGQLKVIINITREMDRVHIQSDDLDLNEATLIIGDLRNSERNNKTLWLHIPTATRRLNQTFALYFDLQLSPGLCTLDLNFISRTNESLAAVFRTSGINEKGDIIKLLDDPIALRTIKALRLLPFRGEPRLILNRSNFTFSLKYMALPDTMEYTVKNGMIWTHFHNNSVTSTHLVAFSVSDLACLYRTSLHTNIYLWCRHEIKERMHFALNIIKTLTIYLKDINSHLSKFNAANYVATPEFQEEGSLYYTWALIPYREMDIIYDKESNDFVRKIEVARLVTCKMVQATLGHLSGWVNKGLAMFLEILFIDKVLDSYQMMDLFVVQNQRESFYLDNPAERRSLSENNTSPSFPSYIKATSLLRMLTHVITDHVFLKGIRKYLEKYAPALPENPNCLWDAMQAAVDNSSYVLQLTFHIFNITGMMNTWMKQDSYPILNVTRGNDDMNISVENLNDLNEYSRNESNQDILEIPVTHTTQTYPNFNNTFGDVTWITKIQSEYSTVEIPIKDKGNGWIIVNLQQTGYYRVNYDNDNWLKIAKYLDSEEYTKIHVLNRAQIIDDAFYLMLMRQLNSSIFWNITSYLSRETSYIAWYPMIKAIENISSIFPLSDNRVEKIKMRILPMLEEVLEKIGYYDKFGTKLTASLRQEAARWACVLGSSNCMKAAADILQKNSADPETYFKIMPWWKEWTYCNGFRIAEYHVWRTEFEKYMNRSDNSMLKFLTCSEDLATICKYSSLLDSKDYEKKIQRNDRVNILISIIARHAKKDLILDYILTELQNIISEKINVVALLISVINHVHSEKQFDKISDLVKNNHKILLPYVERKIAKRSSEITTQMTFLGILMNY